MLGRRSYRWGTSEETHSKMQELEYPISDVYSGYRSYEYQEQLYNNYVAREGKEAADTYSARPGYSEHQTGLAFDLLDTTGNLLDGEENKDAIAWLHTHAHEYGFIIRFQAGRSHYRIPSRSLAFTLCRRQSNRHL